MKKFKRFLPEEPLIENEDFVIYGNRDLEPVKKELMDSLSKKKSFLLQFFRFENLEKISINLFSDHDLYIEFTKQFYEPSLYSRGNFANGMINYSYNIDELPWLIRSLSHELVHIFYSKIWEGQYERVLWLDEGLAQYLSGEMSFLSDDKKFKEWYLNRIVGVDKEIPSIDFLKKHGGSYGEFVDTVSNKYNGYDLSYLLVRYIFEHHEEFILLLNDEREILSLESHVMKDCIDYYDNYFEIDRIHRFSNR